MTNGRWIVWACWTINLILIVLTWRGVLAHPYHAEAALNLPREPMPVALHVDACRARFQTDVEYCELSSETFPLTTVLMGDSHAAHWWAALRERFDARQEAVALLGHSGCPPLASIVRDGVDRSNRCENLTPLLEHVMADAAIRTVWISFRGTSALSGRGYGPVESTVYPRFHDARDPAAPQAEAIAHALTRTVHALQAAHKTVAIVLPVPELGFTLQECLGRPVSFAHRAPRIPCAVARAAVVERQAPYRAIVESLGVPVVDPMTGLCDTAQCWAIRDGQVLYGDSNHLSRAGAERLIDLFEH